jgi:gamma-glutamyltranspeptidase/glutathione hydrolase
MAKLRTARALARALMLCALCAPLPLLAQQRPAPEAASGVYQHARATAKSYMIAAANPLAVDAGLEILRDGGSAADAAVAVQLVLNVVEPQSSGIGGGAFALYWEADDGRLTSYDGREAAPAAASAARFLAAGRPLSFDSAVFGGLSVGVPGALRVLEALHRQHGRLPWARLLAPAIRLAGEGFRVSPRLSLLLAAMGAEQFAPEARRYFFDATGSPRPPGYLLQNPEFAATLTAIASGGADALYTGPLAAAIVAAVRTAPNHQGDMTPDDLANYRVRERDPLCIGYRRYRVCSMGPPSSGGLAAAQVLKLLEPFRLGTGPREAMSSTALHLIAEAEKLAFADRNHFVADPDFVPLPAGLLADGYLDGRRALIDPRLAMGPPQPGTPATTEKRALGTDTTVEQPGTSHFSIVDAHGSALAMTTSIESAFGSRVWVGGFLLNNELTDFAFRPVDGAGRPLANAVAPGKRPRSSMAPTIVLDDGGRPWAVLGSAGGSHIILYVVKTLIALIDWKLDAQAATGLTNFGSRGGPFEVEIDDARAVWHALLVKPYGHRIKADFLTSGTHAILRLPDGTLEGGADPRREGVARGQ